MPLHGSHMASHPASECRDPWSTCEPVGKGPGFLELGSGLINFYLDLDPCPTLPLRWGQLVWMVVDIFKSNFSYILLLWLSWIMLLLCPVLYCNFSARCEVQHWIWKHRSLKLPQKHRHTLGCHQSNQWFYIRFGPSRWCGCYRHRRGYAYNHNKHF